MPEATTLPIEPTPTKKRWICFGAFETDPKHNSNNNNTNNTNSSNNNALLIYGLKVSQISAQSFKCFLMLNCLFKCSFAKSFFPFLCWANGDSRHASTPAESLTGNIQVECSYGLLTVAFAKKKKEKKRRKKDICAVMKLKMLGFVIPVSIITRKKWKISRKTTCLFFWEQKF